MKLGVIGAGGRMGRMLVQTVTETEGASLAAACERPGSPVLGQDAGVLAGVGELGVVIGDDAEAVFRAADAVMEFSVPAATVEHARMAARHGSAHVIGTTGLSADDEAVLREVAAKTAVVYAPNMSVVVNLMFALVEKVAGLLGPEYDIEIVEMHHKHKIDAPSGTAVGLGQAAARGRQVDLDAVAQWSREGHTGARRAGDIGFATLRGGDVVGEHTVMFAAPGERLEISHRCTDRQLFARGGVRAALWSGGKAPGLYTMKDVLGLDL
ncbi:MAG: 4-hydroxy-tetrahydrodipicolinate reductase [Alphaproteobacteria bacterium]|nr:4-hydroxy-tetrahydrodipicolinate reductase [Alphaproteobacteria bacterium]MCB9930643.1 4-hydroxy-tetrahydrodipicolinate reductase [Alphaproteobacteria bacterium]